MAMMKIQGVTQFMDGFFEQSLAEQVMVAIEAVELLVQTMGGDNGATASHLGLAENVFQDGYVQVNVCHAQQAPILRAN